MKSSPRLTAESPLRRIAETAPRAGVQSWNRGHDSTILRPFARYLQTIEPLTEVPPNRILGRAQYRHIPHIYTHEEIRSLLEAAADLRPQGGLRARSFRTYLNLLLCTGMRPPEPLRLTRADVDVQAHTVTGRVFLP